MFIQLFAVVALLTLALAVRVSAMMQRQEVVWDRDVLLSASRECIRGGH